MVEYVIVGPIWQAPQRMWSLFGGLHKGCRDFLVRHTYIKVNTNLARHSEVSFLLYHHQCSQGITHILTLILRTTHHSITIQLSYSRWACTSPSRASSISSNWLYLEIAKLLPVHPDISVFFSSMFSQLVHWWAHDTLVDFLDANEEENVGSRGEASQNNNWSCIILKFYHICLFSVWKFPYFMTNESHKPMIVNQVWWLG